VKKIPFVGPTYQTRSRFVESEKCTNLYLEKIPNGQRTDMMLVSTPGLRNIGTIGSGPIRGTFALPGVAYVVSGNGFYSYSTTGVSTLLGSFSTTSGLVSMAYDGQQLVMVDGLYGYVWNTSTSKFVKITDPDFPNGVTFVFYEDTYFIVSGDGTNHFYISANLDGTMWNGLDYASIESEEASLQVAFPIHDELWLFGLKTIEVWVNTGASTFPYQKSGTVLVEHGCVAPWTVCKLDNTLFWVGRDETGIGPVWRADGYKPVRVSNPYIERLIETSTNPYGYQAFTYMQDGHLFYVLCFVDIDQTFVYDVTTSEWHDRAWKEANNNNMHRWRAGTFMAFNNQLLCGDWQDNRLYILDKNYYLDDQNAIARIRRTSVFELTQARVFYTMLQVDMEVGVGTATGQGFAPQLRLRWSDDGGQTFGPYRTQTVGPIGSYRTRVKFNRLGSGRNRVWEISITDPVAVTILGAFAELEPGTW
jgi:hypothetical protein